MSHVEATETRFGDLPCLFAALQQLGFEIHKDVTRYAWWGRHEGDYKIPEGMKKEDLGKCLHMARLPGVAYEVGIVEDPSELGQYRLVFDWYGKGRPLLEALGGKECKKAKSEYMVQRMVSTAMAQKRLHKKKNRVRDVKTVRNERFVKVEILMS